MIDKYIPNNLEFRMYSAKAREEYSNAQAFALGQLLTNKAHKFSPTAKELLLLKYDMWLQWLLQCEDYLRETKTFDRNTREILVQGSGKIQRKYIDTIRNNPKYFNTKYIDTWIEVHKNLYLVLTKTILDYEAKSIIDLITKVGTTLIETMDATLYELQELDCVLYSDKKEPCISVSEACFNWHKLFPDRCAVVERLQKYEKIVGKIDTIGIKVYTDRDISNIVKNIEKAGYKVGVIK